MSNRTPKEALREIRNRIVYMYGNIDGTFNPPALKEVCEIADDAISSLITEKSSAVGNAAAMREALETVRKYVKETTPDKVMLGVIEVWCDEAISAPARNCDRFADETDAQIAFLNEMWLISVTKETALERDRFENWTDEMKSRYAKWLLAPAAERKGEGDGIK